MHVYIKYMLNDDGCYLQSKKKVKDDEVCHRLRWSGFSGYDLHKIISRVLIDKVTLEQRYEGDKRKS